ncbi:MAG: indolepyruvate ferredoxin oxidoreductase subunit alpha [Candidatus Humimicrobiaceae bacterium]
MAGKAKLLTGNEAIARGAWEAGVQVATAYPGTPSTEILENIAKYREIYSQWSVNEKVALEVASGASIEGARVLVAMKHVGLNVAADPFMTLSYTGVGGGLVIVSADDPYMHSSQNEQDNRYYAKMARVLMLEPSDSQEAKDFTIEAFELSEQFDCPVLLRVTTRISHSRSVVGLGPRKESSKKDYLKDCKKFVMVPAFGRLRHQEVLNRWDRLVSFSEDSDLGRIYDSGENKDVGIITSSISFQYTKEVFGDIDILKLGLSHPLPEKKIRKFLKNRKKAIVIEELEPFIEEQLKEMDLGVVIYGKEYFPQFGELNLGILRKARTKIFGKEKPKKGENKSKNIPNRPPVLCAGCPHRPVFYVLKKLKVRVMGDIGCYTLSVLPPLNSLDTCLCMGAGVGQTLGMEKANPDLRGKLVSVIGDSTFFHSGITPLVDNIYNGGTNLMIILDNRITAMTGHQANPGMGLSLMGKKVPVIWPEKIAESVGVKNVKVIDPYNIQEFEEAVKEELARQDFSVIVARRKCVLLEKEEGDFTVYIEEEDCKACGVCLKFGCPAIEYREGKYSINGLLCTGCGVCLNICKFGAIKEK